MKFKFFCNRYYSARVAFDAPEGFHTSVINEFDENDIRFFSNDLKIVIHVYYSDEYVPFLDDSIRDNVKEEFTVKRGRNEGKAFYFNYAPKNARFYYERYVFETDKQGFNHVNIVLWTINKNDRYAAVKALKRPNIKAFFDSIEYF